MSCERSGMSGTVTGARRFLFEIIPDLFPFGFYSEIEDQVWGLFFAEQKEMNGS
jgi:hypothetical protein